MDLKQLQELGGFVPKLPLKRSVKWQPLNEDGTPKGDELAFDIFVKRLSFGAIERLFNDKQPITREQMSQYISDTVSIGETGQQRLSYQMAWDLDPTLAKVFMDAIGEVNAVKTAKPNGEGEPETKN